MSSPRARGGRWRAICSAVPNAISVGASMASRFRTTRICCAATRVLLLEQQGLDAGGVAAVFGRPADHPPPPVEQAPLPLTVLLEPALGVEMLQWSIWNVCL